MIKQELGYYIFPLLAIFALISFIYVASGVPNIEIFFLFLGLLIGSFLLDIDHFIYWFYLKPNSEEGRLAQAALSNKDFKSLFSLLKATQHNHVNLIFHHYFFQVILVLISFFVFTSSNNTFIMAFLLALNAHLIIDEIKDFITDKNHLQNWLFARELKQLPLKYLSYYIAAFVFFLFTFLILFLKSKT